MRRVWLLAALLLVVLAAVGAPAAGAGRLAPREISLGAKLRRALSVPHLGRTRAAAVAVDLATGRLLYSRNEALSLAPASTEKLSVTYAALVALGPAYRIETTVLGEGYLEGTTWRGDLVLQGHGDPTLSTWNLRQLAWQVRAAGIRRVAGRIVGDETYFDFRKTVPGWKPEFLINESPPLSALVVDRGWFHTHTSPLPALAAALTFRDQLKQVGVSIAGRALMGRATVDAFPLAAVDSAPLATILRFMDRESDNFTAELTLKQLGAAQSGLGTSAAGAGVVRRVLAAAGIPLGGVRIVDGSGLSLLDRLTARSLVGILRASWGNAEIRDDLLAALPVAGRTGTLADRMRWAPARGNVVAKTGTTTGASALAGFVKRRFVFAVLHNGSPVPTWPARRAQDRFATVLAAAQ